tara:strand:+ start:3643 stop:5055 length:1413 start_codon:yes stop_codon:yes gene_type:complete
MADAGLMNQKLQDSFEKLVIAESADGINSPMNKIATSTGTAITGSSFYMGTTPTYGAHAKFIPIGNNHVRSLSIEAQSSSTPSVDPTSSPWPLMEFFSGTSGVNNAEALLSSILRINTTPVGGASCGQIMFGDAQPIGAARTTSKTWGGLGAILCSEGSNDIQFRCDAESVDTASNFWMIDRLKIKSLVDNGNVVFDASNVTSSLFNGVHTVGVADFTGDTRASNFSKLYSTTNGIIKGGTSVKIQDTPDIHINAHRTDGSAEVRIDAYQTQGTSHDPVINIGTKATDSGQTFSSYDGTSPTTPTLDGAKVINIGVQKVGTGGTEQEQITNINSKVINFNDGWFKMGIMAPPADTNAYGPASSEVTSDEASIYFVAESANTKLKWADGANSNKPYYIDSWNETDGRALWIPKTSGTVAAPADDAGVKIYVKNSKLKISYMDGAQERTFELNLTSSDANNYITMSTDSGGT